MQCNGKTDVRKSYHWILEWMESNLIGDKSIYKKLHYSYVKGKCCSQHFDEKYKKHFSVKINLLQGVLFHWYPPKKLKYGKPRLG